jgi:hypothetical protein
LLALGVFALSSCEKKIVFEDPIPPENIPLKEFSAFIDGVEFVDTVLWAVEDEGQTTLTITATADGGYPKMIFNLPVDLAVGSHNLGGAASSNQALLKFGTLPVEQFEAISGMGIVTGTLVVTKHDLELDVMEATFSYTAGPSAGNTSTVEFDVADGEFVISY